LVLRRFYLKAIQKRRPGGQEVAGSNPVSPISEETSPSARCRRAFLIVGNSVTGSQAISTAKVRVLNV